MTAALLTDRYGLRCADPKHLWHGRVFMTCAEPTPLEAYLETTAATCFELVDLARTETKEPSRA